MSRSESENPGIPSPTPKTTRPRTNRDWCPNQLDLSEGRDASGKVKWTATAVDLVFGSHGQLRALAEVYASADAKEKFALDFVGAWTKIMNLDRLDLNC